MILSVHAQPGSKRTEIVNWLDESTVKIRVAAPPVDGKANKALLKFLADELHTRPSALSLIRGTMTRLKQIEIPDSLWSLYRKRKNL